jgi:TPP-dependent pyruvate/acetoin dehydrogenase alpha subunit
LEDIVAKMKPQKSKINELTEMHFYSRAESIDLIRLRYFQHQLNEMLKEDHFSKIPVHLAFGHEAAAVGIDLTLQPDDVLCVSHRNVAYNLARSKSLESALKHYRMEAYPAQLAQMASQNLAVDNTNIEYASSILGNNLAVAAGIAMNRKLMKRVGIVFVMTGDGALEEGVFWEVMIFARSHALGMVVVVENNNFSMSSSIEQRRTPIDLSLVCAGLGITYRGVDGASLPAVKTALASAREDASKRKVALVELNISTFCQHAGPTPGWPDDPLHIALANGLLLGDDPSDPLVQLSQAIGATEFDCLVDMVAKEKAQ